MTRKDVRTVTLDPHMTALASTVVVTALMSFAGLQKNALEWKRRRRICPSCGHQIRGRVCGCN
jgi:hypothetical protein